MRVEFEDNNLRRLYEEPDFRVSGIGVELTRSYRKVVGFLEAATDERDLRALKFLHFEKLEADRTGQYSLRLHKQWRLIVTLKTVEKDKQIVVIEVVDYH
ncbi:MAG: type II toxin-antitoxin system RelE/ParE family toxin [Acidimicrobiales bacterium]